MVCNHIMFPIVLLDFLYVKPGPVGINSWSGANIQIVHYFDHGYLEEEKSMIHSFTVTFGGTYLTGMVISVPPYESFSLIKNNILHQSIKYKNQFENSNFWGMCTLGHVGHVTYSFINMLFISMGWSDDKFRPQYLSVGTTANVPLNDWRLLNVNWAVFQHSS
jgi:hypothetical protein